MEGPLPREVAVAELGAAYVDFEQYLEPRRPDEDPEEFHNDPTWATKPMQEWSGLAYGLELDVDQADLESQDSLLRTLESAFLSSVARK